MLKNLHKNPSKRDAIGRLNYESYKGVFLREIFPIFKKIGILMLKAKCRSIELITRSVLNHLYNYYLVMLYTCFQDLFLSYVAYNKLSRD